MRLALGLALAAWAGGAAAHEFWLQPNAFRVGAGEPIAVSVLVGHAADRRRSALPARRVKRFAVIGPDGVERALPFPAGEDARPVLEAAGAHVVVLATDNGGRSVLPGSRFEAYLREEGLTPAIAARAGRRDAEGSEAYGRRAKALVQAGDGGPQDAATTAVGLTLEITPEVSPYASPRPGALPVRVDYEGRPLAGATVKLADLAEGAVVATRITGADGRAVFDMPARGAWRLSVVWTKAMPATAETELETVFSSLTFGTP